MIHKNIFTLVWGVFALYCGLLAGYQKWVVPNPDAAWNMAVAAVNVAMFYGSLNSSKNSEAG